MSQGPLPIEYSEVSRSGGATAEAGMLPYLDLIEAAGLRQSMRRRVGLREQGQSWTDDQLLTAGVLLNLAGGDSVDDLRVLEGDEGLGRMLRRAERHGLHRRRGEALARRWRRRGRGVCRLRPHCAATWSGSTTRKRNTSASHSVPSSRHRGRRCVAWAASTPTCWPLRSGTTGSGRRRWTWTRRWSRAASGRHSIAISTAGLPAIDDLLGGDRCGVAL